LISFQTNLDTSQRFSSTKTFNQGKKILSDGCLNVLNDNFDSSLDLFYPSVDDDDDDDQKIFCFLPLPQISLLSPMDSNQVEKFSFFSSL